MTDPSPIEPRPAPPLSGDRALLGHTFEFQRDPVALLERGWREQGDAFAFRAGGRRFTLLAGPAHHDAVFKAPEEQLSAKEVYGFTIPIFGRGIAYDTSKERMAEQVGFLFPALNDRRMATYARKMVEEADLVMQGWEDEGELDLAEATNELTVNIAARCLLGDEVRSRVDSGFARLYHDLQGGINAIGFVAPWLPIPAHVRRDRARKGVVELLSGILAERRRHRSQADDFMQTLMDSSYHDGRSLSDDEITGILITALFGGQHTSGVLGAWIGVELLQHAEALDAVQAEIEAVYGAGRAIDVASLREQVVLERTMKEAERLHPPLNLLVRMALQDFQSGPIHVPEGDLVMVSPALSHRLPSVFRDPHRFDPDRFAPERAEDQRKHALITFGGGKHRCIGMAFAYMQLKVIWTKLLGEFELELAAKAPAADYKSWVTGPAGPCRVRYTRRRPSLLETAA